jgi:hypothetical protein
MDLTPYVDNLRRDLAVAAEAGGEDARALAERLSAPLESAARLALLEALSAATDEITRELAPGSVDVRLRGREPSFVVTPPPAGQWFDETAGGPGPAVPAAASSPPPAAAPDADEGGGTSRISLRVPDQLKPRIEEAAARDGLSVNAWLVRAVSSALDAGASNHGADRRPGPEYGRRFTGWVR